MWTAVAAACAALVAAVAAVVAARRSAARAERAFERALERLDQDLAQVMLALRNGPARDSDVGARAPEDLDLTLDLGELLDELLARATVVTRAQAVAVELEGPGGARISRSLGPGDGSGYLRAALGSPSTRFSAMTVGWAYATDEWSASAYRSALVVPIVEDGLATGAVAAYSLAPSAFLPEHVRALERLASASVRGLRHARRFAEVEQRTVVDAVTGVRNRAGYELELDREIARARRTGRPLSLAVIAVSPAEHQSRLEPDEVDLVARGFAGVLTRVARRTDIPCRRGRTQFAIVLPETAGAGADRFCARLRMETSAEALSDIGSPAFVAGTAELRDDETATAFDSRAAGVVHAGPTETPGDDAAAEVAQRSEGSVVRTRAFDEGGLADRPRNTFAEDLAEEVVRARERDHALAVLVIDIDDFRSINEQLGEPVGDRVLADVEARLNESVHRVGQSSRIGADEFGVVLPRASLGDAERVVLDLQGSLEERPPEEVGRLRVSAGVTELTTRDNAWSVLDRARQALWKAQQAGSGTVVVASANHDAHI